MAKVPHPTNVAIRHQVLLERLKTQEAGDFAAVVPKLRKAILDVVNELDISKLSELNKRELQKLLGDLQAAQLDIITSNNEDFLQRLSDLSEAEVAFETKSLALGLGKAVKELAETTAEEAYKAALAQPLSATGQLLEPFIDNWGNKQITAIDNAVRRAWGEGRTIQQLVQEIRGTKAQNFMDGITAASTRQAEAVARTAVQQVSQAARATVWENNDIEQYQWVSTLDSHTTIECQSLDGQIFTLGEGPQPPIHIGCRSTTIAVVPGLDQLDEGATRSSVDGPVPADQTYYEWLADQPDSFQNAALGVTRADLFRDGGLSADEFASLNLNKNFEPLTLDEMRNLEPEAFKTAGLD
jgi:SPP1 gp7 family putative phage head morphogenesis protein